MKYYSAVKRNEVLIHAITWMDPENIMLNEINQTQKDKYCMILLTLNIWNRQIQVVRK